MFKISFFITFLLIEFLGLGSEVVNAQTTLFGCLVTTDNVYACAVNQADSSIAACSNYGGIVNVPSQNCGCTQLEVSAGITGKTCKKNGGPGQVNPAPNSPTTNTSNGMQDNSSSNLYNPLPEEDLLHAFLLVAQGFLGLVGIAAVTFIIIGGFQMVISAGNEENYLKAKKTIIWAIMGLLAALLSFSIVAIVQEVLKADIKPAFNNTEIKRNV